MFFYIKTLRDDNVTSTLNYSIPFALATCIFFFNIFGVVFGIGSYKLAAIGHIASVLSGVYNGVAMALLFSRFISMEMFFIGWDRWKKYFYIAGTVVIFPLYATIQPLFGLFDSADTGDQNLFKALVLLICLIGKTYVALFVYTILSNKWIHVYLYRIILNNSRVEELGKVLKDAGVVKFWKE